jgi:biofilm protein TabA
MILDRLDNADLYGGLGTNIAAALDYLRRTDFSQMPVGRHEVDGDRVFAIVQRYRPKPLEQIVWEAHRKYIDVQFVAAGTERMGYVPLGDGLQVRSPYDAEKDAILFDAEGQLLTLSAGEFAVFFPCDVHAPGLATETADDSTQKGTVPFLPSQKSGQSPAEVCKVVMKCRAK